MLLTCVDGEIVTLLPQCICLLSPSGLGSSKLQSQCHCLCLPLLQEMGALLLQVGDLALTLGRQPLSLQTKP